jgi:hypothetical protein
MIGNTDGYPDLHANQHSDGAPCQWHGWSSVPQLGREKNALCQWEVGLRHSMEGLSNIRRSEARGGSEKLMLVCYILVNADVYR